LRPLRLVIFDCDGVLIDSEPISARVVAEAMVGRGWPVSPDECLHLFLGMSIEDMRPIIEAHVGPLSDAFLDELVARLVARLAREVEPMRGAASVLRATGALGLDWRIASNSSHPEMAAKFARAGLAEAVRGRVHSATDVIALGGRPKPAPDLFLAAAAAASVEPGQCVVVEDSLPGVRGAVAAGMACYGFAPHGGGDDLLAAGADRLVRSLAELPPLFQALMGGDAEALIGVRA